MMFSPSGGAEGGVRTIGSREDMRACATDLLARVEGLSDRATVIALHGDLGAGKTTFVQDVADRLGVGVRVTSPTFVIMKSYRTRRPDLSTLIHIDAYRIEDERELAPLRLAEVFASPHTLVAVEWAERLGSALPHDALHLHLALLPDGTRTMTYGTES